MQIAVASLCITISCVNSTTVLTCYQSNIAQVLDTSDSRVNTITTEFDKERLTMEGTLSEARQQVEIF